MLRPGVDGEMTFRDDHHTTYPLRGEAVEVAGNQCGTGFDGTGFHHRLQLCRGVDQAAWAIVEFNEHVATSR